MRRELPIICGQGSYHALVQSSRERFEETLNWDKWAEGFGRLYQEKILTPRK